MASQIRDKTFQWFAPTFQASSKVMYPNVRVCSDTVTLSQPMCFIIVRTARALVAWEAGKRPPISMSLCTASFWYNCSTWSRGKRPDSRRCFESAELYQKLGEEKRLEFIHQLSHVQIKKNSLAFYDALLEQNRDLATDLMEKLTYSKNDFDDDLSLLLFTLRDKGIEMGEIKDQRFAHYG